MNQRFEVSFPEEVKLLKLKNERSNLEKLIQFKKELGNEKQDLEIKQREFSALEKEADRTKTRSKGSKKILKTCKDEIRKVSQRIKNLEMKIKSIESGEDPNSLEVQYFHLYLCRVRKLKRVYRKHFDVLQIASTLGIKGQEVRLLGAVHKKMRKMKSYLKEIENPINQNFLKGPECTYFSRGDKVYLEDETGQIELVVDAEARDGLRKSEVNIVDRNGYGGLERINPVSLCNGSVVCVEGKSDEKGRFVVNRFVFPPVVTQSNQSLCFGNRRYFIKSCLHVKENQNIYLFMADISERTPVKSPESL